MGTFDPIAFLNTPWRPRVWGRPVTTAIKVALRTARPTIQAQLQREESCAFWTPMAIYWSGPECLPQPAESSKLLMIMRLCLVCFAMPA